MFSLRKKSKTDEVLSDPIRLRVRANSIRARLLKGVPTESTYRRIVNAIDDATLVVKEIEHEEHKALLHMYKERSKKIPAAPSEFKRLVNAAVAGD